MVNDCVYIRLGLGGAGGGLHSFCLNGSAVSCGMFGFMYDWLIVMFVIWALLLIIYRLFLRLH